MELDNPGCALSRDPSNRIVPSTHNEYREEVDGQRGDPEGQPERGQPGQGRKSRGRTKRWMKDEDRIDRGVILGFVLTCRGSCLCR